MTTILVLFLTKSRGFPNSTAIVVGGYFGLFTYGLAAFSGFLADLLGYRRAMLSAYALLAVGYFLVVTVQGTVPILGALFLVALGASLIKPSITGTVQKVCTEPERAQAGVESADIRLRARISSRGRCVTNDTLDLWV